MKRNDKIIKYMGTITFQISYKYLRKTVFTVLRTFTYMFVAHVPVYSVFCFQIYKFQYMALNRIISIKKLILAYTSLILTIYCT